MAGSMNTIPDGAHGWSIYGPDDVVYPGSEAVVWLQRKSDDTESGPWVIEMYVNRFENDDPNDFTTHELTTCQTPLAEVLWQEIDCRQAHDHPEEAAALKAAGQDDDALLALRDILAKAIAYIDVVKEEGATSA